MGGVTMLHLEYDYTKYGIGDRVKKYLMKPRRRLTRDKSVDKITYYKDEIENTDMGSQAVADFYKMCFRKWGGKVKILTNKVAAIKEHGHPSGDIRPGAFEVTNL